MRAGKKSLNDYIKTQLHDTGLLSERRPILVFQGAFRI